MSTDQITNPKLLGDGPVTDADGKADAIAERNYRRGYHQGAEAASRTPLIRLAAWLEDVEEWRNNHKTKYGDDGFVRTGRVEVVPPPDVPKLPY